MTLLHRVKERVDIIGAFKLDPLYLKHKNQESGRRTQPEPSFAHLWTGLTRVLGFEPLV